MNNTERKNTMYKQIIIVRKDLNMSHGKMASQVSHASMAFLTTQIREKAEKKWNRSELAGFFGPLLNGITFGKDGGVETGHDDNNAGSGKTPQIHYEATLSFDRNLYEQWIRGSFTKCVLEAKNRERLLQAMETASGLGMKQGIDFFPIYDSCFTELLPEEENGTTLTCVGFRPMDSDVIDEIGKKYQLYRG